MPVTRNTATQSRLPPACNHNKLRAQRDKIAPQVLELAEAGKTVGQIAAELKMHIKRVQLIGRENGLRFAEPS